MLSIESQRKISIVFLFLGYAIFGFSFLFSKKAMMETTPFVMLAFRFSVAFLIMNLVMLFKKKKPVFKGKKLLYVFLLGLVQPVLYFLCEGYGVKLLQTSYVGIILSMIPMTSFLLGFLFLKEKVKKIQVVFAFVSIVGVFLTTLGESQGDFSWLGFALIFGSVITASMFSVLSRKVATEFDAFERTYIMFFIGFITFTILGLIDSIGNFQTLVVAPMKNFMFWIDILYLAGVSSVGAFLMINYAMTHTPVAKASIFTNLTTVISIIAGVLFLNEEFGLFQAIGSLIIIASVYAVNRKRKVKSAPISQAMIG